MEEIKNAMVEVNTETQEVNTEREEVSEERVVKLTKPYVFEGKEYEEIDLSGLEKLTIRDAIDTQLELFGVEVAAGDHVVLAGKYQRVIGDRVGFNQQHFRRLAKLGQAGSHHLRLTAQRIRVLHLGAIMVGLGNCAVIGQ